jgi:hypothetical protein
VSGTLNLSGSALLVVTDPETFTAMYDLAGTVTAPEIIAGEIGVTEVDGEVPAQDVSGTVEVAAVSGSVQLNTIPGLWRAVE